MKQILLGMLVVSLPLCATSVSPSSTPKLSAIRPDIAQMLSDEAREPFLRLLNQYQPSSEQCRTLMCEEEDLNANSMGTKDIEPIVAHLVAGYKKVWLMDGDVDRHKLNWLLKDETLLLLFDELRVTHLLFPRQPITEKMETLSPLELVQLCDSVLYTPEGEKNAILLYKTVTLGLKNQFLKRYLLGHNEEDIILAYSVDQVCEEGCCCLPCKPLWKKCFELDKAAALKWIEEHSKDYKEWFKTQSEFVTVYAY